MLYKPFAAPSDVVPARQYMTLVSPAAERLMRDAIKGPLNGVACNAATNAALRASTEVPAVADPQNKARPGDLVPMVGLYHGGGQYGCGVLRPAGQCMMRDNHDMFTLSARSAASFSSSRSIPSSIATSTTSTRRSTRSEPGSWRTINGTRSS